MNKFLRILFLFVLINNLLACAPVGADTVQLAASVEANLEPTYRLQLLPLDDPHTEPDLDSLIQFQEERTVLYNRLYVGTTTELTWRLGRKSAGKVAC